MKSLVATNIVATLTRFSPLDWFFFSGVLLCTLAKAGVELFFTLSFIYGLVLWVKRKIQGGTQGQDQGQKPVLSKNVLTLYVLMVTFLLLKLVSIAWAPNTHKGLMDVGTHSHWLLLPFLIVVFKSTPHLKRALLFGIGFSMLIASLWVLLTHLDFNAWSIITRFEAGTGNALVLGAFVAVYTAWLGCAVIAPDLTRDSLSLPLSWLFFGCSLFVLIATWGRMPIIVGLFLNACVLIWTVFVVKNAKVASTRQTKLATTLFFLMIFVAGSLFLKHSFIGERFMQAASDVSAFNQKADRSTPVGIRLGMQEAGFIAFKKAPFLGMGAGSAITVTKQTMQEQHTPDFVGSFNHLHNQYLQIAVEQGAIGLALFIAIGAWAIRMFLRMQDRFVRYAGCSLIAAYALLGLTNMAVKQGALNAFLVTMLGALIALNDQRHSAS